MHHRVDKLFLGMVVVLVAFGFFVFSSASLGLLTRGTSQFGSVTFNQFMFGVVLGSIAAYISSKINYKHWQKYSLYIFALSLIVTACVFLPKIGFGYNGAKRWLSLGSFSFQPSEFLKIGAIMYLAAFLAGAKDRISTWRYGTIPLLVFLGLSGAILLKQPDTATFAVIFFASIAMFIAAGARWSHVLILGIASLLCLGILAYERPYIRDRLTTFISPHEDPLGNGYQIQQSLIAIGSGGFTGRGFGQSIQKFNYLPEPIGDSIFAVLGEEFGFFGGALLILFFLAFAARAFRIGVRAPDTFGGLLAVGIVILIVSESFVNIGSMLGIVPLSGLPLLFVSHGGTALLFTLFEVGIIMNISKYQRG